MIGSDYGYKMIIMPNVDVMRVILIITLMHLNHYGEMICFMELINYDCLCEFQDDLYKIKLS